MLWSPAHRRWFPWLAVAAGVWLLAGPAAPAAAVSSVRELTPRGHVNDFAGVIPAETSAQLEAVLAALQRDAGAEVAIVTVDTVPDADVKTFAVELFQAWGLGQAGQDNGVLLLAAIQDRRVELEVGYGLEGILPDAKAGRLLDTFVIPAFQQGDYGRGMAAGGAAIAQVIAEDAGVPLRGGLRMADARSARGRPVNPIVQLLLLLLMIPLIIRYPWLILLFMGRGGYGGGFGGGGFGGGSGFGGFGGGMSGGGGAGRGW